MSRLVLCAALLAIALAAAAGSASGQDFFECADFTPANVAEACDRAVPIECRGPDAPVDFDQCLRDNGTTPEKVRAAVQAAERAAGIPVGGVDTGMGGLAREADDGGGGMLAVLGVAVLLLGALTLAVRARRA
jgi:hypothetical protein